MKNLLLVSMLVLGLISCKKDDCNCGIITDDDLTSRDYLLEVRNECTGNKEWFDVDYDIWLHGHIGDEQCFTNQSNW